MYDTAPVSVYMLKSCTHASYAYPVALNDANLSTADIAEEGFFFLMSMHMNVRAPKLACLHRSHVELMYQADE